MSVIEGAVSDQDKSVWMTTVMQHSSMRSTAYLSAQTWCKLLRFLKLLMIWHRNRGAGAGWGQVRNWGHIIQKLLERSTYCKLPAESGGMWSGHVMHHSDTVDSGWLEIEGPESFWMQMIIHRNTILVDNDEYTICSIQLYRVRWHFACH